MKKTIWLFAILSIIQFYSYAQEKVEGMVMEGNTTGGHIPLAGANVYWLNSPMGTITNKDGLFSIPFSEQYTKLIISYVGFQIDTLTITKAKSIHHTLQLSNELDEVVVRQERDAVQKTYFSSQNIVTVNSAELLKAACCNLSESFETNPAIDVNFNDALTGTKQIEMLGLTSPYILITQENLPMVRGASQTYGLTFTPGTWVESIQITKGAGSVVNGYESISGQINTELVKPLTNNPLFVNGYINQNGRYELNTHLNTRLNDKWSTGLYIHGNKRTAKEDNNGDGFLDAPLADQINVYNRWQYQNPEKGWVSFIGARFLLDQKQVGQTTYNPKVDRVFSNEGLLSGAEGPVLSGAEVWGSEIDTKRYDLSAKIGYVFPELPFQSFGFQAAFSKHEQDSYFGINNYDIDHESFYSNLLFSSIIGDTRNTFKTGLTVAYDNYLELVNTTNFGRVDKSLGAFFEYSYTNLEKLSLTAGVRFDTHNRLGNFFTPRLHVRYTPWDMGSLRGSFGIGRRAANIFTENQRMFASSRSIVLQNTNRPVYGFEPEKAINFGFSFLQGFILNERKGNISLDFYRTEFENQVVVDWENPTQITFSNLVGESYANSFQIEFNYEILPLLDFRTAYKNYSVKTNYESGLLQKPLTAKNRYFLNLGYTTLPNENRAQWRMDYTLHALGKQRLPDTRANPEEFQLGSFAPSYSLMNAQVTKVFSNTFEIYLGGENLTNFKQDRPVLGYEDPFGPNFDTTIVYAPIMGRMFYAGFRYKL